MRIVIQAAFVAGALAIAAAPASVGAQSNVGGIRSDIVNEDAVRALYAEFTAAWNRHDPEGLGKLFTIDGDHVDPDGRHADGRDEITAAFMKQHGTVFRDTTLSLTVDDVWFLGTDVALVDGTYAIDGVKDPSGNAVPPRKGYLTAILLDERGSWRIAASRLMIPAPLPWRAE